MAGFNALSECEKRLFGFLATAAETDFYWDYDSYYKDDPEQEAGMFVRSNVAQFPPRTELRYDNMRGEKQIVSVAAVSNAVQCKYAAAILADLARRRREEDSGIVAQSSFISYNLRAAYELPTPEHHEGVYAYYFYRLIQRAKSVHMLYCSHADDKSTGEPSRYIYQLDYESGFDVRKIEVGVDVNLAETLRSRWRRTGR